MAATSVAEELVPPERGSAAALSYFWATTCDLRLFQFLAETALTSDFVARILSNALDGKGEYESTNPTELAEKNPGTRTLSMRASSQELFEMFMSRAIDNFQIYVVEILREVLHKQPKILSASKQELTLGYVLQFESIESLTKDWIEGKVASLSYEGFGELEDWCKARGIPLVVPDGFRGKVVEFIAIRNLIVHNRCVVDERYGKATGNEEFSVGQLRTLSSADFFETLELLSKVVKGTDSAVLRKFDLAEFQLRDEIATKVKEKWSSVIARTKEDSIPRSESGGSVGTPSSGTST